jgi:hypothetical protein
MVLSLPLPFLRTLRFGIPALAVVLAPLLARGGIAPAAFVAMLFLKNEEAKKLLGI